MANVAIVPDPAVVTDCLSAMSYPHVTLELLPANVLKKPILPPSGTLAAGGPTVGQLFPIGTR